MIITKIFILKPGFAITLLFTFTFFYFYFLQYLKQLADYQQGIQGLL